MFLEARSFLGALMLETIPLSEQPDNVHRNISEHIFAPMEVIVYASAFVLKLHVALTRNE